MPRSDAARAERLDALKTELAPDLEVIRLLGTGRMAEVYLAREVALDRLVAVKVLSNRLAGDDQARARFDREARAAAALDSPYAVSVYRFGHLKDGSPYLVMQYVRGGTLEDRLAAEGPLPEAEARRILGDVADALATAHEHDFFHRDVRPANVLCDREAGRVFLSDFGLAGIRPESQRDDGRITRTGEVVGTPGYLAPEQLRGEPATETTDVFALGVMAYELLTGEHPFPGSSHRERFTATLRAPPTPLLTLRPNVHPHLADLIERCLAKEPERRPTAAFLKAAFRKEPAESSKAPTAVRLAPDENPLEALLVRKLPQTVAVTTLVGLAVLSFVGTLADVYDNPVFQAALVTFVCSVVASGIIAWFHGKKGKQRVRPLEVLALGVLAVIWLGVLALIFLR